MSSCLFKKFTEFELAHFETVFQLFSHYATDLASCTRSTTFLDCATRWGAFFFQSWSHWLTVYVMIRLIVIQKKECSEKNKKEFKKKRKEMVTLARDNFEKNF